MDLLQCVRSLFDLHAQLQRAVVLQGEIQAEVFSHLLHSEKPRERPPHQFNVTDGGEDNLELLLAMFENALANTQLPRSQWGLWLAEFLTKEDPDSEGHQVSGEPDYETLKAVARSRAKALEEQRLQDFCALRYEPHRGVRELGRGVEEAARRWLRPERRSAEEVVRRVELQRFLSLLPHTMGNWLGKQQPQDLEEAIGMAESYLTGGGEDGDAGKDVLNLRRDLTLPASPGSATVEPVDEAEDSHSEWVEVDGEDPYHLEPQDTQAGEQDFAKVEVVIGSSFGNSKTTQRAKEKSLRAGTNLVIFSSPTQRGVSASTASNTAPSKERVPSLQEATPLCSHKCPDCGRGFKRQLHLRKHRCVPGSGIVCPHCEQVFPSQRHLADHRRNHQKALHCPDCGKQFRDKYNLRCHLRTHTGERPYMCPDCGAVFAQERGLQEHQNIHTGDRPFLCGVCGRGFRHSRTLYKHTALHSEVRPFLCPVCGKTFRLKDTLRRHQATHRQGRAMPLPEAHRTPVSATQAQANT